MLTSNIDDVLEFVPEHHSARHPLTGRRNLVLTGPIQRGANLHVAVLWPVFNIVFRSLGGSRPPTRGVWGAGGGVKINT